MVAQKVNDRDFVRLFEEVGPKAMARQLDMAPQVIHRRRRQLEKAINRPIVAPNGENRNALNDRTVPPGRLLAPVYDGTVLIGSDAHYWPGIVTTAHRAFVKFCKDMQPNVIVMNGDIFDGASISRHPPIGWEDQPSVIDEIEACKERLEEIEKAAPNARRIWPLGNHDARFETRLATVAPEYAKVHGVHLKDHFPLWEPCWSVWINDVVVKHRFRGGIHAAYNNTVHSGKTIVTGHLHSLKALPFDDYNGTRWGIDTGTLADKDGPQFHYKEDNPSNQRAGFVVLSFVKGKMLVPSTCHVWEPGVVCFERHLIDV